MFKKLLAVIFMVGSTSFGSENIVLSDKNTVVLRNEVSYSSVSKLQKELAYKSFQRGLSNYTIYIVLDSPGGSIDAGLDFIAFAKSYKNVETVTLFAASMASAIAQALPGARNVTENGVMMFHRASGGVEGQFEDGELESRLAFYKGIVRNMEITNSNRMKMTLGEYKAQVKDELWIFGKDNVTKNAADKIVSVSCDKGLLEGKSVENFLVMGMFSVEVEFSSCPLIKGGVMLNPEQKNIFRKYRKEKNWSI